MSVLFKYFLILVVLASNFMVQSQSIAKENQIPNDPIKMKAGYQAFESICASCHTQSFEKGNRIAPPISKVKLHYLQDSSNFDSFKNAIINFLNEPSENIKMKGAFNKFGAMPKLSIDDKTAVDIAYYIYHTPLENSKWSKTLAELDAQKYQNMESHTNQTKEDFKKHGLMLAMQTKSALGSQLKQALGEKGVDGAISFCNEQAIPITSGMSEQLNANIKRVSDRPRNPNNAADHHELAIINSLKQAMDKGKKPTPTVVEHNSKMIGYYPIVTNGMCLGCHGSPEKQIDSKTLSIIRELYPQDKAIGYNTNQLRGLFVVEMEKEIDAL